MGIRQRPRQRDFHFVAGVIDILPERPARFIRIFLPQGFDDRQMFTGHILHPMGCRDRSAGVALSYVAVAVFLAICAKFSGVSPREPEVFESHPHAA